MSTISIKCVDQVLAFQNMPIITAGDQNVDKVQFDFCPLWDGFVKVAVFFQQKTELSYALINADGSCNIPNSILKLSGKIFIAVTGTNTSNQVRTSNILSYFVDEGIVDADIQDEFPSDISEEEKEDIYNKILEMCVEMQNLCQDLITNFAYVRVEGANTFEYEASLMEAKVKAYTYTKAQLDDKFSNLNESIGGDMTAQLNALDQKIDTSIADLNTKLSDNMDNIREDILTEIDSVKVSVSDTNNALLSKIVALESDVNGLINNLQTEIDALHNECTSLSDRISALGSRVIALEKA